MKKLLFASILLSALYACSDNNKGANGGSGFDADTKAVYEQNLATLKTGITAFENEDLEGWAAGVADSAWWNSPAYGDTVHTKDHWKASLQYYMDNWDQLKLRNAIFLPGVDTATHKFDGSVRYYGQWEGVHKSGVATSVNFYGTYDFNADHKIITGSDYFDLGGMMNSLQSK